MEIKIEELDLPTFLQDTVVSNQGLLRSWIGTLEKRRKSCEETLLSGNLTGSSYEDSKLRIAYVRNKHNLHVDLIKKYTDILRERFGN